MAKESEGTVVHDPLPSFLLGMSPSPLYMYTWPPNFQSKKNQVNSPEGLPEW